MERIVKKVGNSLMVVLGKEYCTLEDVSEGDVLDCTFKKVRSKSAKKKE